MHPDRVGRPFFINLSIAPLFPYAYAHSRRISCDVFATIEDTAYLLNAVTYGWWINDALYRFSDPDHTVLYKSYNQDPVTEAEARSRLNASVISGTVLMAGDDFRLEPAKERASKLLANPEVLSIARKGRTFIPAEKNVGDQASEIYFLHDRDSADVFVAVFHLSREAGAKQIDPASCGIPDGMPYEWTNLWSGTSFTTRGAFEIKLDAMESTILHGRPMEE